MDLVELGKIIQNVRERTFPDLNRTKAARRADIHHDTLKGIELGTIDARLSTLIKIAEGWNVPIWKLLKGDKAK
jgi:hypothetical protein